MLIYERLRESRPHRIDLVNFVAPKAELLLRAIAWTEDVSAECSPIAMADAKHQLHEA